MTVLGKDHNKRSVEVKWMDNVAVHSQSTRVRNETRLRTAKAKLSEVAVSIAGLGCNL